MSYDARDDELEAAEFYWDCVYRAAFGKDHEVPMWGLLDDEVHNAMAFAVSEFKKRYVCAG